MRWMPLCRHLARVMLGKLMRSFLDRLADRIANGGKDGTTAEDVLPKLFAPELRNVAWNSHADDPSQDMVLVTSLIRPTLSRLRATPVEALVGLRGRSYTVSLRLQGPEKSKGPVKVPFRITAQFRHDFSDSLGERSERTYWANALGRTLKRYDTAAVFPLDRLGEFGRCIRRAVELGSSYTSDADRTNLTTLTTIKMLDLILLPALSDEEKRRFLSYLLGIPTPPNPDPHSFADWFIEAAEIQDDDEWRAVTVLLKKRLIQAKGLSFGEKLFFLSVFHHLPIGGEDRFVLSSLIGGAKSEPRYERREGPRSCEQIDLNEMVRGRVENFEDFVRMAEHQIGASPIKAG